MHPFLLFAVTSLCLIGAPDPVASHETVEVSKSLIRYDDGDTIDIEWESGRETVRILGIDTPEVLHIDHGIPFPQPFGYEAKGFLGGCIAGGTKVELVRSGQKDPYQRTLGYLLIDGKNYSVLVIEARLAIETVSRYGDNGMPEFAKACVEAAKNAGPVPFEDPHQYRGRMRKVTEFMKAHGTYPTAK